MEETFQSLEEVTSGIGCKKIYQNFEISSQDDTRKVIEISETSLIDEQV
jgi:hypothetical protein